jgi:hypothetical protein
MGAPQGQSKARHTIDRASCLEPCPTEGGNLVGRDPLQMGRIGLEAAGFEPSSPMEVIRAKCLDCCAGSAQEVRYCVSASCPSWPYRMGSNPFRAERSSAQIEASKENAARMASRRSPKPETQAIGSDAALSPSPPPPISRKA